MSKFSQIDIIPELDSATNPRIGLIALSTDFTIEQDYRRICHNLPLDIFVNRIPFNNPLNHENYLKMSDHLPSIAKNILPDQELNTIAYGFTSGTVAMGENLIANQIKKSKPNTYVTTPITAALKAFKKLNIKKISVLTPYPKPVNESVFNYLLKNNIEVLNFSSFNLNYDSEIAMVKPDHIVETICKMNHEGSDAIFVSCTALRIVEVLQKAEEKIKKTIISSNQSMIWDSIRSININNKISNFGKLLLN